jgi:iron complex outermembrane receptor protein
MIGHPVQQLTTSPRALATLVAACAMPFGSVSAAENVRPDGQILEEVAVTASRVAQPGFKAPTPTTVITAAELEHTGAPDVAAYLNTLPAFRPSRTPTTTIQSGTAIGVNLIDLRGLGTERSLVLVNSRRHVPTQATGAVDFNVIPSVALGSVEVITGGASAAWGSDAVAGVVNLLFDHDLQESSSMLNTAPPLKAMAPSGDSPPRSATTCSTATVIS